MPSVFVGWGVPRSHEKGDPRLTRSVRLRLRWITPRQRWRQCRNCVRLRLACNTDGGGLGPWYFAKALAHSVGLPISYFKSLGLPSLFEEGRTEARSPGHYLWTSIQRRFETFGFSRATWCEEDSGHPWSGLSGGQVPVANRGRRQEAHPN